MNALLLTLALALGADDPATPPPPPTVTLSAAPAPAVPVTFEVRGADGAPRVGDTLRVVVRPGSPDARELGIGITDTLGRVVWKPTVPGVTELYVGDTLAARFSVAWPWPPPSAIVPLLITVFGALGALAWGARR